MQEQLAVQFYGHGGRVKIELLRQLVDTEPFGNLFLLAVINLPYPFLQLM